MKVAGGCDRQLEHESVRNEERIQELLAERQTQSLPANGTREQHLTREVQRLEAELAALRKVLASPPLPLSSLPRLLPC